VNLLEYFLCVVIITPKEFGSKILGEIEFQQVLFILSRKNYQIGKQPKYCSLIYN